jgi:hypothetical protein
MIPQSTTTGTPFSFSLITTMHNYGDQYSILRIHYCSCWIMHPYPRKIVVSSSHVKGVFMNVQPLDGEFVDSIIRCFNQLDLTFVGTHWRHFLETDFGVSYSHNIYVHYQHVICLSKHIPWLCRFSPLGITQHMRCGLYYINSSTWTIASRSAQWCVPFTLHI